MRNQKSCARQQLVQLKYHYLNVKNRLRILFESGFLSTKSKLRARDKT